MTIAGAVLRKAVAATTVACFAALPLAAEVLTLDEAIRRALAANLGVERSRSEVVAADHAVRLAIAERRPRFTVDGRGTFNSPDASFALSEELTIRLLPETDYRAQAGLRLPLYMGGRLATAHQQSQVEAEGSRDRLRGAEERLLLRVVSDYLTVVRGDALMAVEVQSVELARNRLHQADAFYQAGEVTRVDVLRARAAIKSAERRLASARLLRESAEGALRVDLASGGEIVVERPEDLLPPPAEEAALVARALQNRPELAAARQAWELVRLEVDKAKGARRPTVLAEAALVQQRSNFPSEQILSVNLGVSIPLYQGGSVAARVAIAEQRALQARLALDELRLVVREEVRATLVELDTAETTLGLAAEQLVAVLAEHEQISDLYEALEATSLDVAAAELALAEARRAVVNSSLDRDLSKVRLYYAVGELKSAFLEETAR